MGIRLNNKSSVERGSLFMLITSLIIMFLFIGEIKCIYKATQCDWSNKTSWKAEVIYTVSACTGLGSIVGWFDIEDK